MMRPGFSRFSDLDQVAEDHQHAGAGDIDKPSGDRAVAQDDGRNQHHHHATGEHGQQFPELERLVVGVRTDVVQCVPHHRIVAETHQQANAADGERDVPAQAVTEQAGCVRQPRQLSAVRRVEIILDDRRQQHRDARADVDGHVVDGEGAVDLAVVAFVDLAHQVAGVGLEQAVADHDHAQRHEQEHRAVRRHHHQCVADRQHDCAQQHGVTGAEELVANPAADRGRNVDQRGRRAPGQVGRRVLEAQPLHHVVDDQRLHAVVAEALPHLDQEYGRERAGVGNGRHGGIHVRGLPLWKWRSAKPTRTAAEFGDAQAWGASGRQDPGLGVHHIRDFSSFRG